MKNTNMNSSWANPENMKPFYFEMVVSTTFGKITMDQATHSKRIKEVNIKSKIESVEHIVTIVGSPYIGQRSVLVRRAR
jgi:hypothetical protein